MQKLILKIITGVWLFTQSCGTKDANNNPNKQQAVRADGMLVTAEAFTSIVPSTANILPFEQVDLSSPVSGNVLQIYFNEGQHVKKGDLMVKIDDRAWKAQLKGQEARLSSMQKEFERAQSLLEIEGASQEDVDRIEAELANIQAQIEELSVMISLANVRAPFAGQVGMRNFSLGAYLSQGETITQLVQTNQVKIDFSLPSRYASLVKKDHEITVLPSASSDTATAIVYAISPILDASTRTLHVRAILNNDKNLFIPGDFANVRINMEQLQEALFVPSESVIPELNANVIYKLQNGKAKRQLVEVGIRTENAIQITQGITVGDTVLVSGLLQLDDGDDVEIGQIGELREGVL